MERIDHVAIVVNNINRAIEWYTTHRDCKVKYQDDTWAILQFENIDLALVLPYEHPPHIAFEDSVVDGDSHRDGSEYLYDHDTFGNIIEKIKYKEK
jgi:catechol 2,3-dioxygenase-like lactoylglutathione lyase family enzyme|tara:strand:+ start:1102 stop:1389 length:288 start_codon:yes stop_codon:yes gene_type:complete